MTGRNVPPCHSEERKRDVGVSIRRVILNACKESVQDTAGCYLILSDAENPRKTRAANIRL